MGTAVVFARSALVRQLLERTCLDIGLTLGPGLSCHSDLSRAASADLLLLHVDVNDMDAGPAISALRARSNVKIIAIHNLAGDPSLLPHIAGLADAVLPEADVSVLLAPVLQIVGAGYRISPAGVMALAGVIPPPPNDPTEGGAKALRLLSGQELAVLERLPYGWANKQIARDLGIAEATVKVHLRAIFRKLDVPNRTAAAIWSATNLGGGVALPPNGSDGIRPNPVNTTSAIVLERMVSM